MTYVNQALEDAIDEVGRDKVFQYAREVGWLEGTPPEWVWWQIVNYLRTQSKVEA